MNLKPINHEIEIITVLVSLTNASLAYFPHFIMNHNITINFQQVHKKGKQEACP